MDLLTDPWIPVRPIDGGAARRISYAAVLCQSTQWNVCLPRDDLELATIQLLICMTQVIFPPHDEQALKQRCQSPLIDTEFEQGIVDWQSSFQINHPDHPFMQVKGVKAKAPTGMEKLLPGVTGSTSCTFVNEAGFGSALCGSCAAIALFNQANNAPGFGGGFKSGLRGGAPMTTLVMGGDLRQTLWLNVLTQPRIESLLDQPFNRTEPMVSRQPIQAGETINADSIGLVRGLFWQPAHIELCSPIGEGQCSCCGLNAETRYNGFHKAKFNFTVNGMWPHPHSPRRLEKKKDQIEQKFVAFTTAAPTWTQISRVLVQRQAGNKVVGQKNAAVVDQIRQLFPRTRLQFLIGGYRNNQASILERRHEVISINQGWQQHSEVIERVVELGLAFKTALRRALYTAAEGVRNPEIKRLGVAVHEIKGLGVAVHEVAERQYFRQSDLVIPQLLAQIQFEDADVAIHTLQQCLRQICVDLFEQVTSPYLHHPKQVLVLAVARRMLMRSLNDITHEQGANNGQAA